MDSQLIAKGTLWMNNRATKDSLNPTWGDEETGSTVSNGETREDLGAETLK